MRNDWAALAPMTTDQTYRLDDVTIFAREMLKAVEQHPSVTDFALRICFDHIRCMEDLELLSSNSKLVSLALERYGSWERVGERGRNLALAYVLNSLPNLSHLNLDYRNGLDIDRSWFRCSKVLKPRAQLDSLTLRLYHAQHCHVQEVFNYANCPGVKAVRMVKCRQFLFLWDVWQRLFSNLTTLEIIDPTLSSDDSAFIRHSLSIMIGHSRKLEALRLQNIGVSFFEILPGLHCTGASLQHLRIHDLTSYGLDQTYDIVAVGNQLHLPKCHRVEPIAFLRHTCPNLTKFSLDITCNGLVTDKHTLISRPVRGEPDDTLYDELARCQLASPISSSIRSFAFLRHLIIVVTLSKRLWSRDLALHLASRFWAPLLQCFELVSPKQFSEASDRDRYEEEHFPLTNRQPWWIIRRRSPSTGGDVRPEDLFAVNRIAHSCKVDWHQWVDFTVFDTADELEIC